MLRSARVLVVAALCVAALVACNKKHRDGAPALPRVAGNGVSSSQARTLAPFTRLVVKGALALEVTVGKDTPLELHGDGNLFAHVTSNVVRGELTLDTDAVLEPAQSFRLTVGSAQLDAIAAAVAAHVTLHGVKSDAFSVQTAGAANVTADGSAVELSVGANSASRVVLSAFAAAHARISAADFARIELGYVETLDATQRNYAVIAYHGSPALTTHAARPQNITPLP